jgi:hypothetical protein
MAPRKPTEKMWVDRTLHENRLFLQNEVLLAADEVMLLDPGNPWQYFTCKEAEMLACIFAAAGRKDVYDHIISQHALEDEAEEIDFHLEMRAGEPGPPLGRESADA